MTVPVKLPDSHFHHRNGAECAHVFLWRVVHEVPFMKPVTGWAIVGYGRAPWEGSTDGFAVMFEKTTPADKSKCSILGEEFEEGTRIWQHGREAWVPGLPAYEERWNKKRVNS